MKKIEIYFEKPNLFSLENIKPLNRMTGLYFIFLSNFEIQYPFKKSRLLYIGMSEKRTCSIGKRLADHFDGKSGNIGITSYKKTDKLNFTYINFEMFKRIWPLRIEDLESYFILSFVSDYGVYPICNNKTGFEILKNTLAIELKIDWHYFDKKEAINE
jgi:hypothetical protein